MGINLQEFVRMVSRGAEGPQATALGALIYTNLHKVDSMEFKSDYAKVLWERNHVHHKKADMDYGE